MPDNYYESVLTTYKKKKSDKAISINLMDPTPAKLRDECLIVYNERYSPKDDDVLRLFFSWKDNDYEKGIENYQIDGFRQLVKVLNGQEIKIGIKYIKLLAWLINFDLTDLKQKKSYSTYSKFLRLIKKIWQNLNLKKSIWSFVAASVVVGGSYLLWDINKQCMYWNGDEYIPVAYDAKIQNAVIIALDRYKVKHMKRITRPDTITSYSVGKVGRATINGKLEFFTDIGENPTDNKKRLLPLTQYMLEKHIQKK
jgi:hypothetical protein